MRHENVCLLRGQNPDYHGHCRAKNLITCKATVSPRKLHPVLRVERAERKRFTTGQKNYVFGCLMIVMIV